MPDKSKILVSGCGISYTSGESPPTWIKILKICGLDITDLTGPAITNGLICNLLITELHLNQYSHVICQLTHQGKLDVEINDKNKSLMEQDSLRNFSFQKYWPSSFSTDHIAKKMYYDYLYSPGIEEKDLIIKLLYLQELCNKKNVELLILEGTKINWTDPLHNKVKIFKEFCILDDYKTHDLYKHHDHSQRGITPNKFYQVYLAKKINDIFLKQDINLKLNKFK